MDPLLRAFLFFAIGLWSAFNAFKNLKTGVIDNKRGWVIERRDNPGGFYLYTLANALFAAFAAAVVLNAFGLTGDPFAWLSHTFAFLRSK